MNRTRKNTFGSRSKLTVAGSTYRIIQLETLEKTGLGDISRLPFSIRILLENLLRKEDGIHVVPSDIEALCRWTPIRESETEIAFSPARVLMQDFTGVPALVDLAAMRDAVTKLGGDPQAVNPKIPVDLVIDHSIQVDKYASPDALRFNSDKEYQRNRERYGFLRWGQQSFHNFRVVPPATGICHQVNLEHLGQVVFTRSEDHETWAYPDTLVGTDSHTPMINGLGILGWGVGGIEAEASILGQPISLLIPDVIGVRFSGELSDGVTATDLVLTVTQILRKKKVVGKFVEYFGPGLSHLSVADRATLSNMSPEYGATIGFFPVDEHTLDYLRSTGRPQELVTLVENYTKQQGLFRTDSTPDPEYTDILELDLGSVEQSLAGPKRPQDRIGLKESKTAFASALRGLGVENPQSVATGELAGGQFRMQHGHVVIAAITSCTNTSNPSVMIGAGLLAKKAVERGLQSKPWVKTSLAPGSKVVTDYLQASGLLPYLEKLGFGLVGYGCTTCIGNSGPLPDLIVRDIEKNGLVAVAVLSGNRNFEGRIHPHTRGNYLMSPLLVVAYALAGRMNIDLWNEPLGLDLEEKEVFLKDVWPSRDEVRSQVQRFVKKEMFERQYSEVFGGDERWLDLNAPETELYAWDPESTYMKAPPFLDGMSLEPAPLKDIVAARVLVMAGDSLTTDHISPAGAIPKDGPAGRYLIDLGIEPAEFNSFGSRRGNHEVMLRGTFGNIRLHNLLTPDREGGWTMYFPRNQHTSIYEAAMLYKQQDIPLIVLAGKEYGTGSSRDWAAKGTQLLGIKAVLAESFERIHRSNLIGMGVLPLQFLPGESCEFLGLRGTEVFAIVGIAQGLSPGKELPVTISNNQGEEKSFSVKCRVDTPEEMKYYLHGGILPYVIRRLLEPDP